MFEKSRNATIRVSGTNLNRAKDHNFAVVLEVIRFQGPLSRADIARATALSRQTVQNIVATMDELGLVDMQFGIATGRGHPGVNVSLKRDGAHFFGVHVDRTQVTMVLADMLGGIVWSATQPLADQSVNTIGAVIMDGVDHGLRDQQVAAASILGCGIAAAGPFDDGALKKKDPTAFAELGAPGVLGGIEARLGLPMVLGNDADAAAMGEGLFGQCDTGSDFATLHFGIGLGAALIVNGEVYHGANGNAGEIGHVQVAPDGPECACGKTGCLERFLSFEALCQHLSLNPDEAQSFDTIAHLSSSRAPQLMSWIEQVAPKFRQALGLLDAMLSPRTVIITGSTPTDLLQLLVNAAKPYPVRVGTQDPIDVSLGHAGRDAIALGAAAISMNNHFAPSTSRLLLKQ